MKFHEQFCPEPHLYLGMIGVSPTFQGEGIGRKLLEPVLKKADRTNMPCYLETTTTGAVRFYERLGFEVVHQDTFLDHQYWLMKRYPQNG